MRADDITFEPYDSHVICRYAGPYSVRPCLELARAVLDYCVEHRRTEVLLDMRRSLGAMSVLDRYEHGVEMMKFWRPKIRLAVVGRQDQVLPDQFWVTVTRNRGAQTGAFTNYASAQDWLGSDPVTYFLTSRVEDEYLHVRVEGENTIANVLNYMSDIFADCIAHQRKKVLVEEMLHGPELPTAEMEIITTEAGKNVPGVIDRMAYLDLNPDHSRERLLVATAAARERGIGIWMFDTVEAAREWLTSRRSTPTHGTT